MGGEKMELRRYRTAEGGVPYSEWLGDLDDSTAGRVSAYVDRMKSGNFGKSEAKMRKKVPYVSHEKAQGREFRENPKRATEYLNSAIQVAFEESDPELVLTALATLARAYGMTHVAKAADLKRESLHRMLSRRGNPEWNSMFRVLKALHLRPKLESTRRAIASPPAAMLRVIDKL